MVLRQLARGTARLFPPLRRLHDFALQAEAGRMAARREADKLAAQLSALRTQLSPEQLAAAGIDDEVRPALGALTSRPELSAEEINRNAHWLYLKNRRQLIELDFPVTPKVRHGHGQPPEALMLARLTACSDHFASQMRMILPLLEPMLTIPSDPIADASEPNWVNPAFPALDAMALYGMIALHKPERLIEIGSGFSTKFARRAIRDHRLDTQLISIDPEPRAEIDDICDEVIRAPLEEVPISFFETLTSKDMVFFDGSHRSFQNSDVTVFFNEILPRLKSGTVFGIHDIFLPDDYPPAWLEWYFNEQYLLASWLLAGDKLKPDFAAYFIGETPDLHAIFASMWSHPNLVGANHNGGAFFSTIS
ncbi:MULTISPECIES: class I SAM-dependent methyltransferase [unclassified Bosea (in: a-proteobacteria)]|uniref:class I SAM-dependent methyltransferase n=1 Tax=unclassified Bosea (in: a-proteobacteria) TaxID=2653178 RepID=UPI000F7D7945|nr:MULTISPECIES: class I SAM-dependent methyltransferase [unclassified Bosea (in: a-proteobacteria)]